MGLLRNAKGLGDANLERLALVAILLFAAALRLWGIDRSGFANTYYAAAVRSMTLSLHNFLYLSFDPAGFRERGQAASCLLDFRLPAPNCSGSAL